MRRFTMVQPINTDAETHWKLFLDSDFDRVQYLEGFGFPSYELVYHRETDDEVARSIKVTPKLDVPAAVAKVLGPRFGYLEEGTFDKKTQVWRSRLIPNILSDRLSSDVVARVTSAGEGRCTRTCELSVEAKVFAVGGLLETALEKNLRKGWDDSARYLNEWVERRKRAS